jgi:hypothetical protein
MLADERIWRVLNELNRELEKAEHENGALRRCSRCQ